MPKSVFTKDLRISALDHRGSLKKLLLEGEISRFKTLCVKTFSPFVSSFLLDKEYGIEASKEALSLGKKVIFCLEETGYSSFEGERVNTLYSDFSPKKAKELGASFVKLLLYYNARAKSKGSQLALLKEVYAKSQEADIPLILEPITFSLEGEPFSLGESILEALEDVSPYCDILKLQFPVEFSSDPEAGIKSAKEYLFHYKDLSKPWVLLSRGMRFSNYLASLKVSKMVGGALGFAVGRSVWQEVGGFDLWEDKKRFIETVAKDRFKKISKVFEDES